MKRLIPILMGSMTAACLGGSGESLTFEEAKVLAPLVGRELAPVVEDADTRVSEGAGSLEEKRAIFAELFGPQLTKVEEGDGVLRFGDAFRLNFETAESIDGRPTLLTWSLTGGQAFFYEPTVLDVRTGAIYQGSYMGASDDIQFFGPLMPGSRIVGTFTMEELWEIDGLVRSTLHEESPE